MDLTRQIPIENSMSNHQHDKRLLNEKKKQNHHSIILQLTWLLHVTSQFYRVLVGQQISFSLNCTWIQS